MTVKNRWGWDSAFADAKADKSQHGLCSPGAPGCAGPLNCPRRRLHHRPSRGRAIVYKYMRIYLWSNLRSKFFFTRIYAVLLKATENLARPMAATKSEARNPK